MMRHPVLQRRRRKKMMSRSTGLSGSENTMHQENRKLVFLISYRRNLEGCYQIFYKIEVP